MKGGSFLRELFHLGESVVPKAATDWTGAICSKSGRRITKFVTIGHEGTSMWARSL